MATKITASRSAELKAIGVRIGKSLSSSFALIRELCATITSTAERKVVKRSAVDEMLSKGEKTSKGKLVKKNSLERRFDRALEDAGLAWTSRKAKSTKKSDGAKKGDEAVGGDGATVAVMSDKQCRQALMAATLFIAEAQQKPPTDFLDWSGRLLVILTPKAVAAKRTVGKSAKKPSTVKVTKPRKSKTNGATVQ